MAHDEQMKLPPGIVTVTDLSRLQRELEGIDAFLTQAAVRERRQGAKSSELPRTTKELDAIAKQGGMNLLLAEDRNRLKAMFETARRQAPVVHISFAAEPPAQFLHKIAEWFRREINPLVLLQIGLEPSIAAGCIIRTKNRRFDLSLRKDFARQRDELAKKLAEGAAQ